MNGHYDKVIQKLKEFIRVYYLNELLKGGLFFGAIGLVYFLLILLIENFFWLSPQYRKYLFFVFISIEFILLIRFLGIPLLKLSNLSKQISYAKASEIIGRHFEGEIDDRLLNLVQLNTIGTKTELLLASIDQKAAQLSPIPFNLAIDFKKSFQNIKYLSIPLGLFLIVYFIKGLDWFSGSLDRVVNYNTVYEAPAPFHFKILNKEFSALQYSDYVLEVTTYGDVIPKKVAIRFDNQEYFLDKIENNHFRYTFSNLTKNCSFELISGEQSLQSQISVFEAPIISAFQMEVIPPTYLKKISKIYHNTGNAIVHEGSKVKWLLEADNASKITFIEDTLISNFINKTNKFKFQKPIQNTFSYEIASSNNEVTNYEKMSFSIEVIKDKLPTIQVQLKKDTLSNEYTHLHLGQVSDDYGLSKLRLVYFKTNKKDQKEYYPISVSSGNFDEFTYQFPIGLNLEQASDYSYYFEVFDNDAYNGFKSATSKTFTFRKLSVIEKSQNSLQREQIQLEQFSHSIDDFNEFDKNIERFSEYQKQDDRLLYRERERLKNILEQQADQQNKMEKFSEQLKENLQKIDQDKHADLLKEQLERTQQKLEKNKKLVDEIEKLLEKMEPEDLKEKIDELNQENKKATKNLNQVLELTKRYFVIDKHQRIVQMLELLSQKQQSLSERSKEEIESQQQINKEWNIIQNELNDLRDKNQQLKKPMKLDDDPIYEEKIKSELGQVQQAIERKDTSTSKQKQKSSATMMRNLAEKMAYEQSGEGMSIESLQEDTQMLRQVLDNLVVFSLSQESNMNHFEGITSNSPKYSKLVKRQHVLREHFNHIDDSLYALSSRNPRVGTTVNDLISDIDDNLEEAILSIADNHASAGSINLHYVINYANDLALMLSEKMNMMNESMKPGKKGKGQKQQGFQLPDIIKKQKSLNEAMKNAMQMGKPQTGNSDKEKSGGQEQSGEQGKEGQQGQEGTQGKSGKSGQSGQQGESGQQGQEGTQGKSGKSGQSGQQGESGQQGQEGTQGKSGEQGQEGTQGKSGKSGQSGQQGNPDEESDYEKIFEIYKQQQTLRNQLSDKLSKDGMSSDGQRILKEMEQVEDDLLEKGFTQETLNRMMNLKHQLFKLSTAQFQQGEDNKRQSKTAGKQLPSSQVLTPEQIKQYFNTTEILNRQALPLQPKYKEKVKQYFITHD